MKYTSSYIALLSGLCLLTLPSCSWFKDDVEAPLPGERISVLELQRNLEPEDAELNAEGFVAPEAWSNEYWPQAGGYPNHSMQNLSLNPGPLAKAWSADIGDGSSSTLPLTAQPIVFDNKVYTLDTASNIRAFDLRTGKEVWHNFIRPKTEDEQVIGGGIAYSANILYVTSGYNEILALNPQNGGIYWRTKLESPSRAAPTVLEGRVFVITLDNRVIALDAKDGKRIWDYQGLSESAGLIGAASPAAGSDIVIPALSSGEILALRVQNGSIAWSDNLSPAVRVGGLSTLPDIQALPILDKGLVIALSFGGRMAAIDARTGQRVWQRDIGGSDTPWIAGNHLFLISSASELVALGRDNGTIRWVKPLAGYVKADEVGTAMDWNGPVYAGGRLIVTGPEGIVLEINPVDGKLLRRMDTGQSIATAPIVAGSTLLLLHSDGMLAAYR
jgi:outer membrane protein assembly factor BamB